MDYAADYVFLHGGGQGSWVWGETIAALRDQTNGKFGRAIALDIPGCGVKRGRDIKDLGPGDVADELLAEVSAAGMKDIILVGHSQAGTMLPRLVEKRPDLFRRLVYLSCIAPLPGQNVIEVMGTSRRGINENEIGWPLDPKLHSSHEEQYPLMFCNDMSEAETSEFLAKIGHDMWPMNVTFARDYRYDHLAPISATFVICLKDGSLPLAWQKKFAERLKVDRIVWVDAGHQAMNTRPHCLAEILRQEAVLHRRGARSQDCAFTLGGAASPGG
jgi:pimeloyl-ACP methyl ester carboxylesterase